MRRHGATRRTLILFMAMMVLAVLAAPTTASAVVSQSKSAATPINVAAPAISGTSEVGKTLSCSTGTWTNGPTVFSFVWLRDGALIVGQSGSTYLVQGDDQGHAISCRVTASNGSGSYTIGSLPSGSYRVRFTTEGEGGGNYLSQFYAGKTLQPEATPVPVASPGTSGGINAEMHAGGQIGGRVVDSNTSAPLSGIFACAETAVSEVSVECSLTNSNGEYTISDLPSGSYKVEFSTFFSVVSYYTMFFNEKSSFGTADTVNVTAGSASTGINARMLSTDEGGQISGTVTKAVGGGAIEGVEVCAYSESLFLEKCATTGNAGQYTITGLAQASYTVGFSPEACGEISCTQLNYLAQYYNEKAAYNEAEPVEVTANKTTVNVNGKLDEGGEMSGRVTGPSGESIADAFVCAEAAVFRCESTGSNGEYTLKGLPAATTYVVAFGTFGEGFVPLYYNETTSRGAATDVTVTTGGITTNINAKMVRGGRIEGVVTDAASHQPVAEVQACAYVGTSSLGCAQTLPSGKYEITGLESGTYEVKFYASGESLNYLSQSIPSVSVVLGDVAAGENAELRPGGQIAGIVSDAATHKGIVHASVCAEGIGGAFVRCVSTDTESSTQAATSSAVKIAGGFSLAKKPVFDAKTDDIDFFFKFSTPGKLRWNLFFKNADVGFADSLGISQFATRAEAAKHKGKAKKCKKGELKHHGKCKRVLIPFGSGSKSVAAGTVEVKVHADPQAIKALKSHHTLHVSGTFTFQPSFGGPAGKQNVSVLVRSPRKRKHHKK